MPKVKMKKITLFILLLISFSTTVFADDNFFEYPQAPENLTSLTERANYLVEHFWDKCNLKSSFSHKEKMTKAFTDYVTYIQYATKEVALKSITALIEKVKKSPKDMLTLGQIAEKTLYGDSAQFWSDELYLQFASAVSTTKKLSKAEKARFVHHTAILENSMVGNTPKSFKLISPEGSKVEFDTIKAPAIILFFNDIDCTDCRLAKVRLATDLNLNKLIDKGIIKIVSIYPGEATDEWKEEAKSYPKNWIIGACDDIYDMFDMRVTPTIYQLDENHTIIAKSLNVDGILNVVGSINL